ncbi:MAG: hypothetical protein PHS54_01975 [Clostridia bacterium]|nr:hypothetical protein [Clostridia bacterium]
MLFNNSASYKNIRDDLERGNLSHAYLFLSVDDLNNSLFINEVSNLILCDTKTACGKCASCLKVLANSHPDILNYPKNKSLLVEDTEDMNNHAYEMPMLAEKKIIIVNNIDNATIQAQNKMLKTLEEPPKSVIFFLTAKNENKILPTIISRSRKVNLSPLKKDEVRNYLQSQNKRYDEMALKSALDYGEGWIGKTIEVLDDEQFIQKNKLVNDIVNDFNSSKEISIYSSKIINYRDNFKLFLELLSKNFNQKLENPKNISQEGVIQIIEELNLASQKLDRYVNLNLIVDNLLMKILEVKYLYKI